MIKRRAPIQSVLAQRKLFAAGGMVAQQPAAQQMPMGMPQMPQMPMGVRQQQQMPMGMPMGMPMPQQMPMGMLMGVPQQMPQQMPMGVPQQQVSAPPRPQQMPMGVPQQMQQRPTGAPQGILASSRSLIDAVAADAVNPAGGNTLSMKKGGLASDGRGNLHLPPTSYTRISPDVTIPGYTSGGDLSGLPQGDIIALMHGGERPVRPQPQPEVGDPRYPPTPVIGQGTDRQNMSLQDWQKVVFGSDTRDLPFEAMAWRDNVFSPTTGSPGLDLVQGAGDSVDLVATGLSRGVNFVSDAVLDFVTFLQGGDDSPVGPIPSETDYLTYAMQIRAVEKLLRNAPDVKGVSKDKVLATISESAKEVVKQNPDVDGEVLSRVVAGMVRKEYDWQSEMFSEKGIDDQGYLRPPGSDAAQRQMGSIKEARSGGQRFNREGFIEDPASMDEQQRDQGGGTTDVVIDEATDGGDAAKTDGGDAVETAVETAAKTAGGDAGSIAAKTAVETARATVNQSETTPEDNKKTMKKFKDEFMEAMPKYEGMTESEKGFLIAEAGLRVMAGQSPNAIKNIAEGLKGLGPELMKGAKEKRDWNRQVELSAVKYGIERFNKAETEERKLETTTEKLIGIGNGSFKLPNGKTVKFKEGEVVFVPKSIILETGTPGNLIDPQTRGIQITAAATRAKAAQATQAAIRKELIVEDSTSKALKESFLKSSDKVVLGYEVKALIENSFDISDEATGIKNFGKELIFKGLSATGWRPESLLGKGSPEEKEAALVKQYGGRKKYNNQMQEVANRLLKRLLGEGSKNVSNVDRLLAQEISGLVKDISTGISANPTLLRQRLKRILEMSEKDIEAGQTEMQQMYSEYSTRIQPGMPIGVKGASYSDRVLAPLAKQSLLERRRSIRTPQQQQVFGSISGFTFKDGKYVVNQK